jgi:MOSC domain-containing protein YiiM
MKLEGVIDSVLTIGKEGSAESTQLQVRFDGIEHDKHRGFVKPADARNKEYKKGTLMRNDRMWSAVSTEELRIIAETMNLHELAAALLSANFCVRGIPAFTQLPRGSKLVFPQQTVLVVEGENDPCLHPGKKIVDAYGVNTKGEPIQASMFPKAAIGRRGLVGVVEREGIIAIHDRVEVLIHRAKEYSIS